MGDDAAPPLATVESPEPVADAQSGQNGQEPGFEPELAKMGRASPLAIHSFNIVNDESDDDLICQHCNQEAYFCRVHYG